MTDHIGPRGMAGKDGRDGHNGAPGATDGSTVVALTRLGVKLDTMDGRLQEILESLDVVEKVLYQHSVQLEGHSGTIATQCQRLDGRIDKTTSDLGGRIDKTTSDLGGRIDTTAVELARVKDKQTGWAAGQGALTLLAASLAAWLGMRP